MATSKKVIDEINEKFKEWRLDWNLFAKEALKVSLDEEQQKILTSIQENRKVSVCSGTARGKDFLAATASLCFLYLTPYWDDNGIFHSSTVINTGPTDRQVKNIMMREIKSRFSGSILPKLKSIGFDTGRVVADGIKFDMDPNLKGKKEYANIEKWYMHGFKADDTNQEAWTGIHNTNILIVVTEASGIAPLIFDGINGCLQGNSKLLLVHNPNNNSGEAYSSMRDPQYKSFRLSSLTSPNVILGQRLHNREITQSEYDKSAIPGQVDFEWVDEMAHKLGWCLKIREDEMDPSKHDFEFNGEYFRPGDAAKVKILGVHLDSDEDTLIPLNWIEAAQQRWIETSKPKDVKAIRGVDVAGMGSDFSIFADRYNDYLDDLTIPVTPDPNTIHVDLAEKINIDIDSFESVLVDAIGDGAGVFSILKAKGCNNVYAFKNSYGAKGLTDVTEARKFLNMRSFTHWAMRDWLDPRYDSKAMLPVDQELTAQLTEIKYKIRDGVIRIEEKADIKKRLGCSPDKADALAQTFAPVDRMIAAIKPAINRPRPGAFGG